MKKLISQGAEAKIYLDKNVVTKDRIIKSYRHPQLDQKIRTRRTKSEAKLLTKAKQFANIPAVISTDKFNIQIEHIPGDKLSETLNTYPEKKQFSIMQNLGKQVASLHENNIIHGDLTTSNTILRTTEPLAAADSKAPKAQGSRQATTTQSKLASTNAPKEQLFIIDFGLGFISQRIEDKAVDIHLIKQALEAKHFQNHKQLFKQFIKGYKFPQTKEVLTQLEKVESRGRYKH